MTAIKYVLSAGPDRSPSIEEEKAWCDEEGELFYGIHARPRECEPGEFVYFIRKNRLVGRGRIVRFAEPKRRKLFSYGSRKSTTTGWQLVCADIESARRSITASGGFQSFRYVRGPEIQKFQAAFE